MMNKAAESEIVKKQLADSNLDVFSGITFDDEEDDDELNFEDMITIDEDKLAEAFVVNADFGSLNMDEDAMTGIIMSSSQAVVESIDEVTQSMVKAVTQADAAFAKGIIDGYKKIATITVNDSTAPETNPDVSAVTAILEGQLDDVRSKAKEAAKPEVEKGVKGMIAMVRARLESASTVEEAEAVIDMLGLDEEAAAQLKSTIVEVPAGDSGSDDGSGSGSGDGSGSDSGSGDGSDEGSGSGDGSGSDSGSGSDEGGSSSGSDEGDGSGDGGSTVDVTATIAAIEAMEDTLIDAGVEAAADQAAEPMQNMIDKLENASNKAEADAVIDEMGLDDTQAAMLKSQIKKQFEDGGETSSEKYITLAFLDAYKENAISDENIGKMTGQIEQISLNPDNTKKIVEEAFDNYYGSLTPDANGLVPVKNLPPTDDAVNEALANNSSALFEEGYNLAKEYMALLVAKGTGEALAEAMAPLSDLFSGGDDILTVDTDKFAEAFQFNKDEDELSRIMEAMITGEDTSYKENLLKLGYQDKDDPTGISFYFNDFESKNAFTDFLENYNDKAAEEQKLQYTDITGILMGSVETIVNAVTYVLIAFVSISLIVSSIMIGIITYISVLERTKEIGILRAIGASKRNISSIFNAETCIIGLLSGIIGVVVTRLLLFPINDVIHKVTEIDDITAVLEPRAAVALVIIATVLTMIGGLIPSQSASKKDPVIALRTE